MLLTILLQNSQDITRLPFAKAERSQNATCDRKTCRTGCPQSCNSLAYKRVAQGANKAQRV